MFEEVFSSIGDLFRGLLSTLSSFSMPLFLVGAVISFFFALFGYKLFKIFVAFLNGSVGLSVGAVVGAIIMLIIQAQIEEPSKLLFLLPIGFALLFCIWFAYKGYKNPFGLIKAIVGIITFLASMVYFGLKMAAKYGTEEPSTFTVVLNYIILPALITAVVCGIVGFILSATVIIGTSFGGAFAGSTCLLSAVHIPMIPVLLIILTVILGAGCLFFQIRNVFGKCTLKEFFFKDKKNGHST